MSDRVTTAIKKVTLNDRTFSDESFEPTLINFFFGKNGTGKSTIAVDIGNPAMTEWVAGAAPTDYSLMVYNELFIKDNIQSYGNIPGVFTITKQNANIKAEVDRLTGEKTALEAKVKALTTSITAEQEKQQKIDAAYEKTIWDMTKSIRKDKYPATQAGYTTDKKKFVSHLESITPADVDEVQLAALYAIAYGPEIPPYDEYTPIDVSVIPTSPLLQKAIIGSSHTAFADFVHALNASGWLSQGHSAYQHAAGDKCPYCQQDLPKSFEADFASCFDEQYQQNMTELSAFAQAYRDAMNGIYTLLDANTKNRFATELAAEYKTKFDLLMERARSNVTAVQQKLTDPSQTIELADLSSIVGELNDLIERINEKIRASNAVLKDKPTKKQECVDLVWQLMASKCQAEITVHSKGKERSNKDIETLDGNRRKVKSDANAMQEEIGRLNQQTVNTTAVKDSINRLLTAAGFQGFHLREKLGAQYVYELVRDDDKTAHGLSEGERNFIAFLYFYHMVIGSQSDDGKTVNKIVVIDDPVSSMDSSSMFTVASLVRDLIAICYNNYEMTENGNSNDHIKQLFCLTHNPYFFKEVSYNRIMENECVAIFEIRKLDGNRSVIIECTREDERAGGGKVNYSPVKNTYDALWEEYRIATDSTSLLNVTRRILEYYYLQICGYSGDNLRADLLERNKPDFEVVQPDGSVDKADYNIAVAMIAVMNIGARGFNDGLYFDVSAIAPEQIRTVFEKVFVATGQEQHYGMMMST